MPTLDANILVVDDDPEDARTIAAAVGEECRGCRVSVAHDGAAALQSMAEAASRGDLPRVVLLDLNLPKLSGLTVLRRIRARADMARVPVVVLTSSREASDVEEAYALGANSYLCKPVEAVRFIDIVKQAARYWAGSNEVPA